MYELLGRKSVNLNSRKDLKLVSLFSGCGGMDIGFEGGFTTYYRSVNQQVESHLVEDVIDAHYIKLKPTRFQTVLANDILPEAKKTWQSNSTKFNLNPGIYFDDSIVDLVKMHKSGIDIFPKEVDVVTGGFPCQDFSLAGNRQGFKSQKDHMGKKSATNVASIESRGMLYFWMKEVIEIVKPKVFIAENVKGLANLDNVVEIIRGDFESSANDGYFVYPAQILLAADYGVPQSRERIIFIGVRKDALKPHVLQKLESGIITDDINPYPRATHGKQATDTLASYVTVGEVFRQLDEPDVTLDPSQAVYSKAKYLGKSLQGQSEVKLDGIGPTIRAEHHGNIEFRRLSKQNGGRNELNSGLMERRLTPRECALIQTFPPDYVLVKSDNLGPGVSASQAYKVIGNAVPPLLAYKIAKKIESIWSNLFI